MSPSEKFHCLFKEALVLNNPSRDDKCVNDMIGVMRNADGSLMFQIIDAFMEACMGDRQELALILVEEEGFGNEIIERGAQYARSFGRSTDWLYNATT